MATSTLHNRGEQKLAAVEPFEFSATGSTLAGGAPKNRRGRRKAVFWHDPTQSWGANGRYPDGSRWRRYGFVTEGDAETWVFQTLAPKDELGRLATELSAPILRDVAHALNIRMMNKQTRPEHVPLPIVQQVKVDISILTDRMSKTADRNEVEALRKRIIGILK